MVENSFKYIDLSKEIVMNFIDFAKMNVKHLIMLLDRKNKDYVKILQSMMTVGFTNDKSLATVKIADVNYKVLKMTVSSSQQDVEEIAF